MTAELPPSSRPPFPAIVLAVLAVFGCGIFAVLVAVVEPEPEPFKNTIEIDADDSDFRAAAHKHLIAALTKLGEKRDDLTHDDTGVGRKSGTVRLQAVPYQITQHEGMINCETAFSLNLPDGRVLHEYVGAQSEAQAEAIERSLASFSSTTLPLLYKLFINPDAATEIVESKITVNETDRTCYSSQITARLSEDEFIEIPAEVSDRIREVLSQATLDDRLHWIKVIYVHDGEKAMFATVRIDDEDVNSLTEEDESKHAKKIAEIKSLQEQIKTIKWPNAEESYQAKQFFVIR